MVGYPNNWPSDGGVTACIVAGGHIERPAPDKSNNLQVIDPIRHSPQISGNPNLLPFITMIKSPTMEAQETNNPPPEPGSMVYCMSTTGDPSGRVVLGQPNEQFNSQSVGGNLDLTQPLQQFFNAKTRKIVSKGFKQSSRGGAEVRIPNNGEEWYHSLTRGLPTHAATFPLAGTKLPSMKNIETAIQQFSNILSPSMLSQLPGQITSLASMLGSMSSSQKQQATRNMPREVADGFNSMINLMQTADGSSTYSMGNRCNADFYMAKSVELLSQVTNAGELESVMNRLQYDESVRGLNTLPPVNIKSETAFGTFSFNMDANGTLTFDDLDANTANISVSTISDIYSPTANVNLTSSSSSGGGGGGGGNAQILDAMKSFGQKLLSGATNAGISPNQNLFGQQAQKVAELMGRLPAAAQTAMKGDLDKAMSGFHTKITDITKSKVPLGQLSKYFTS